MAAPITLRMQRIARALIVVPLGMIFSAGTLPTKAEDSGKPATKEDIYLYRGMGSSYVCNARAAGIEFPKAVGVAAATYTQVLNGRHGGKVASVGDKKLSNKQLFTGAEIQIITGAIEFCPKEVPEDIVKKVKKAIKDNQKSNDKSQKKRKRR